MKEKKIDIIITHYNRKERLLKTLDILSKQTEKEFNLIINDDGSNSDNIINPNEYKIITKYIWNVDDGYHRVYRFNESASISVSPKMILLDDDCVPQSEKFVETYVRLLDEYDVIQGNLFILFANHLNEHFFSTANLGIRKDVYNKIGLFDINFDGSYGYEDIDLGYRVKNNNEIKFGLNLDDDLLAHHGYDTYKDGDRSDEVIGKNKKYLEEKWGIKINKWGEILS
jgi:glycosyltransferase involved in cell wall biosynthesis